MNAIRPARLTLMLNRIIPERIFDLSDIKGAPDRTEKTVFFLSLCICRKNNAFYKSFLYYKLIAQSRKLLSILQRFLTIFFMFEDVFTTFKIKTFENATGTY